MLPCGTSAISSQLAASPPSGPTPAATCATRQTRRCGLIVPWRTSRLLPGRAIPGLFAAPVA
eukprot:5488682-Pyramimonas_sp.AAC.1